MQDHISCSICLHFTLCMPVAPLSLLMTRTAMAPASKPLVSMMLCSIMWLAFCGN